MVLREGRFGPYVTDGETNASLRKGDEVASITVERAAELLAERRARGPAPKRRTARAAASGAKEPAATKRATVRKAPAKKAPAKKAASEKSTTGTDGGTTGASSTQPRRTD